METGRAVPVLQAYELMFWAAYPTTREGASLTGTRA
jgi:hypothetical protein